jgi:acetylornithine deacetylase/succinyl-diaminopimelate desuccinylase-like protein
MAVVSVRDEVTELLRELIRVDTTNPPGNETAAAELLRAYLEDSGAECELYARVPPVPLAHGRRARGRSGVVRGSVRR